MSTPHLHKDAFTNFISHFQNSEQSQWRLVGEGKKVRPIQTMESYATLEINELLNHNKNGESLRAYF